MQDAHETSTTSPRSNSGRDRMLQGAYEAGAAVKARADTAAHEVATGVEQRPYASLAVAVALGFALGALWKVRTARQRSLLEQWASQIPSSAERLRSYLR